MKMKSSFYLVFCLKWMAKMCGGKKKNLSYALVKRLVDTSKMAFCTLIQTVDMLNWKILLRSYWTIEGCVETCSLLPSTVYIEQVLYCFSIYWWTLSCFLGIFWGEYWQSQVLQNYFILVLSLPSPFYKELLNGGNIIGECCKVAAMLTLIFL